MSEAPSFHHRPVLGARSVALLDPQPGGLYLDGTVGGGGHARLILERCDDCRLLAVDRDPEALDAAAHALAPFAERVRFLSMRFDQVVADLEVQDRGLDGALLDLGVSSHQIDVDARGFTFRAGAPLDMRMTPEGESAADFLNTRTVDELYRVFREFGEEPRARGLAREVVRRREGHPFATSSDLVAVVTRVLGPRVGAQDKARIFQAIRIAINDELEVLAAALPALRDALRAGGVLVVIAYHSLEDRIVKQAFREWSRACICPPELPVCVCRGEPLGTVLTRRPERPSDDEVAANPRARSARLRAWRKAA